MHTLLAGGIYSFLASMEYSGFTMGLFCLSDVRGGVVEFLATYNLRILHL